MEVDTEDKSFVELFRLSDLYDIYGELLTEKQKNLFEAYYYEDLSLREIAEENKVTPQAVRDNIKRAEKILQNYEEKLQVLEKKLSTREKVIEIIKQIEKIEINNSIKKWLSDVLLELAKE